jgi:hypothetical protein
VAAYQPQLLPEDRGRFWISEFLNHLSGGLTKRFEVAPRCPSRLLVALLRELRSFSAE